MIAAGSLFATSLRAAPNEAALRALFSKQGYDASALELAGEPPEAKAFAAVTFRTLASLEVFPEGPSYAPRQNAFYFSGNVGLSRINVDGSVQEIIEEPGGGGTQMLPDGSVLVVGKSGLRRVYPDGRIALLADGKKTGGGNDLSIGPDGEVYFSVPSQGIYRLTPGLAGRLDRVSEQGANGIDVDPTGRWLYLTSGGIQRHRIRGLDQALGPRELVCTLPKGEGGGDGCVFDVHGNFYSMHFRTGVIRVADPERQKVIAQFATGTVPASNLCFGGPDNRELLVTAGAPRHDNCRILTATLPVTGFCGHPGATDYPELRVLDEKADWPVATPTAAPTATPTTTPTTTPSEDLPVRAVAFLESHCYTCHDDDVAKGDLNLLDLPFAPGNPDNWSRWAEVLERVRQGEMPPKEEPRPAAAALKKLLADLEPPLIEADRKRIAESGRGRVRRLNRAEFETVLADLFEMPMRVREDLPEDARKHGFDTVGGALNMSSVQMEAYLEVLDGVLDRVTALHERPVRRSHRLTYREETGIMQVYRRTGPFEVRDDGVAFFATEKFSHLNAVMSQFTVPYAGRYRIRVSASALRSPDAPVVLSLRAGGTGHAESNHVPHQFLKHIPLKTGEPARTVEWEGWLERGHYLHLCPTSLPPIRFAGRNEEMRQHEYQGPAAVVHWVEVDGPILDAWPPAGHQLLWGALPTRPRPGAEPNRDPIAHLKQPPARTAKPRMTRVEANKATGNHYVYDPERQTAGGEPIHRATPIPGPLHPTRELVSSQPRQDAERLLLRFAQRAFRRPVERAEIVPVIDLVQDWLNQGHDFESAMRVGYKTLLTSPGFLFHHGTLPKYPDTPAERTAELDDYALAERLAFFLWNGLPDHPLLEAAANDTLSKPVTLRMQADRMLDDPRAHRFLDEFIGQWLDLRQIDFTTPDDKLYPEFDPLLRWSMLEETRATLQRMLRADRPTAEVVDADSVMVNWRLARHYGLPLVEGMALRPVRLPADSVRGGLLTQASILKVTANGTTTSPVVRGTWVLERIMGVHPKPPPPGIPAIEPDIRGAITVRDQLDKHRSVKSCAACHVYIDPPGMALESFDVIGGWREHYRALHEELAQVPPRYSPFKPVANRYQRGLPVEPGDQLADGRHFDDVRGFKSLLLEDPRQIARGLAEKLVIYATGAEVRLSGRAELEALLDRAELEQYGFRTLILEVVASSFFRQK